MKQKADYELHNLSVSISFLQKKLIFSLKDGKIIKGLFKTLDMNALFILMRIEKLRQYVL